MKNQTNAEASLGSVWSVAHRTLRTSSPCGLEAVRSTRALPKDGARSLAKQSDQKGSSKAMKTKTDVKAGSPTLPLPPPGRM
jgi:hypothetical protein